MNDVLEDMELAEVPINKGLIIDWQIVDQGGMVLLRGQHLAVKQGDKVNPVRRTQTATAEASGLAYRCLYFWDKKDLPEAPSGRMSAGIQNTHDVVAGRTIDITWSRELFKV